MYCHYLYRSATHLKTGDPDVARIYALAQSRNEIFSVTGCLHHEDGVFYQWIEGPSRDLEMIMSLIISDRRHHNIEILSSGPSKYHYFEGWSMAAPASDKESLFDFLTECGISRYQGDGFSKGIRRYMSKFAGRLSTD